MTARVPPLLLLALLLATPASGSDRYELGRRLRAFEAALEEAPPAARERAMGAVQGAVMSFFMQQGRRAAEQLDTARLRLGGEASGDVRWAASLGWTAPGRLLDPQSQPLVVTLRPTYGEQPIPAEAEVVWQVLSRGGALGTGRIRVEVLPLQLALPQLPDGDHVLRCSVRVGGQPVGEVTRGLSVLRGAEQRIEQALAGLRSLPQGVGWEERAAGTHPLLLARSLQGPKAQAETDLPLAGFVTGAERDLRALSAGEPLPTQAERWLRLGSAERAAAARLLVPPGAGANTPLVVALHGMGGSENMFFDAYGAGTIARLCRARGWILLAPRTGGPPLVEQLDSLARVQAFDRQRVALVGHSMGAGEASVALARSPDRFAAAAFLGGGGTAGRGELPPCFVAAGTQDFGAGGARALARQLKAGGAEVTWRQYPAEHLTVVQLALPDVFRFFDEALSPRDEPRWGPL